MGDSATRWLWSASMREHGRVLGLSVCQAVYSVCGVVYALMLRGLVDAAVAGDAVGFWRWAGATALLIAVQISLRAIVRWLYEFVRARLENTFKRRLFDALLHGDYGRVAAVHSAEWMNRLTNDAKVVADGCTDIVPGIAGMLFKLVGALVVIIWLDPRLAVVIVPGGLLLALFSWLFRRVLKRLHKAIQEADGRLRIFLQERIGALLTVRSYAAEARSVEEQNTLMDAHLEARMRRNRFSNFCNVGFGAIMQGAQLGAIVWCGYGILTGTMSYGTLMAMAQLVGQIQGPLANMTGYLPRWYAMLASAERLSEAESLAGDNVSARPLDEVVRFYEEKLAAVGLADVSFAYWPASEDVSGLSKEGVPSTLEQLSLEVRTGEFLACAGHSGCGKSTALRLLMTAFEPDVGERYLELRNGERQELDASWRRLFAYVPQGNQLMGGTIREVVSLADPDGGADDVRLMRALRTACADEFVAELPNGVDTLLGERGAGLSEGQMQRISVARAVFSESPVLLLDEATSALDAATEARLLRNLRELHGRTVVIVTHRPAALEVCDRVLTFTEEGCLS